MKSVVSTFLIVVSITVSQAQTYDQDFQGKVVNVIDGNTFEVENENGDVIKLMLSEVDCPEIGQAMGDEAKAFTNDLILKKKVSIELKGKDWLGNKLAILTLRSGKVLHEELIKSGLAWASKKASSSVTTLEASAKNEKLGLWSENEPTPPWVYRRQQTMLESKSR